MKIYVLSRCPFGHRAVFAATVKQLDFELSFFERGKRPPELEAVGPRAKSPTVFDGDVVVHDSQVVLEYFEDRYPECPLMPATPAGRAEVRMVVTRYNEELAPRLGALVGATVFAKSPDPERIEQAKKNVADGLVAWDELLAGKEFVAQDRLSLADITVYTQLASLQKATGFEIPAELRHLGAWLERMGALPGAAVPVAAVPVARG